MITQKVTVTLTDMMLGTKPLDPEVFATWVASKAEDGHKAAEIVASQERAEKGEDKQGITVFHADEKGPFIWAYQVKGFFKDACGALRIADGTLSKRVTAYKTRIDQLIFVNPDKIYIKNVGQLGTCERPLRAETMQGPRVTLARSESIPAGSMFEFTVTTLATKLGKDDGAVSTSALIEEWLRYGSLRGMGQWRNSGKGRFAFQIEEVGGFKNPVVPS